MPEKCPVWKRILAWIIVLPAYVIILPALLVAICVALMALVPCVAGIPLILAYEWLTGQQPPYLKIEYKEKGH